jgi:hypothetical protein
LCEGRCRSVHPSVCSKRRIEWEIGHVFLLSKVPTI